jgi:DNA-binding transcriptional LysR family regulator
MDFNAAHMFVYVVQAGSLSAAAERLDVPLPTVSRRIRELERQLKVQLLERSARGVRLTVAGTRLYEYAIRGVEALEDGEQAVRDDQARLRGRLRLSLPPSFEPWWALLRSFQQRYPDIQLNVYSTERRVDLIQDGIDVALRIGAVEDDSLVAQRIMSYRHILVASPVLLARLGEPKSIDDLHRYPCAAWISDINMRSVWKLGKQSFEPRSMLATNDYFHLRNCALTGQAVTELPPFLAAPFIKEGSLCRLLSDAQFPEQTVNLLYTSHRYPSTLVRVYLEFCKDEAEHHFCKT